MAPSTTKTPSTVRVTARHNGKHYVVQVGDLGATASTTIAGIPRAAKDYAYLSGQPWADTADYVVDVDVPVDAQFQALIDQARDRDGDPSVRRDVARRLRDEHGLLGKEIALVLGFTHQWVAQLLAKN